MRGFNDYKVTTVTQAISLLTQDQEKAAILAGGSDMLTICLIERFSVDISPFKQGGWSGWSRWQLTERAVRSE